MWPTYGDSGVVLNPGGSRKGRGGRDWPYQGAYLRPCGQGWIAVWGGFMFGSKMRAECQGDYGKPECSGMKAVTSFAEGKSFDGPNPQGVATPLDYPLGETGGAGGHRKYVEDRKLAPQIICAIVNDEGKVTTKKSIVDLSNYGFEKGKYPYAGGGDGHDAPRDARLRGVGGEVRAVPCRVRDGGE